MIQVWIGRGFQLQGLETDIVECLIVKAEGHITVLHQLMSRQHSIVRLNHNLGHLESFKWNDFWFMGWKVGNIGGLVVLPLAKAQHCTSS